MRKIRLLLILSLASLPLSPFASAQGPKPPEVKRRPAESAPREKPGRWNRERKAEPATRAPERAGADKKPGGRPRTRDKAGAWDRSLQKAGRPSDGRPAERDKRAAPGRRVDKAKRWERAQPERARELRPTQRPEFLEHVFRGQIKKGKAQGFHYEGARMEAAYGTRVIEGTRTAPDSHGVYTARVQVRGIEKERRSTFFPRSWSRADVVKAINEAYASKRAPNEHRPNYFEGMSSSGVRIGLICNKHNVPVTAFPIMEHKR